MPKNVLKKTSGVTEIAIFTPDPVPVYPAETPYPITQDPFSLGSMNLNYEEQAQSYVSGNLRIMPEAVNGYIMSSIYAQNQVNVNELMILGSGYSYPVNLNSSIPKPSQGNKVEIGQSMTTSPPKTQATPNINNVYSFNDPLAGLKSLYPNVSEEVLRRSTSGYVTRMPSKTVGPPAITYGPPAKTYGAPPLVRNSPIGGGVNVAEQNQALYNSAWSGSLNYGFP